MSRTFFSLNKKRKRAQKLKVTVIETLADTLSAYEIQNQANPGEARKLLLNLLHKVAKFQENLRLPSSEMTADQIILLKLKLIKRLKNCYKCSLMKARRR